MATIPTCLIWQVLVVLGVPIGMEILNIAVLAPRARSQVGRVKLRNYIPPEDRYPSN